MIRFLKQVEAANLHISGYKYKIFFSPTIRRLLFLLCTLFFLVFLYNLIDI